ncbi:MAG: amino acid adenylation domain-containing protein, partial [Myxococcales bacterium]|nr:amino acid adenylation domain-containing protein [Myxococcales bacterium]
ALPALFAAIVRRLGGLLGADRVEALALRSKELPRTTSGKIRRAALSRLLETELLERRRRSREALRAFEAARAGSFEGAAPIPPPSGPASRGEPSPGEASSAPIERSIAGLEAWLRAIWAGLLELPEAAIGPEAPFRELGGTSLQAIQVLEAIERELGLRVHPLELSERGTIRALATWLREVSQRGEGRREREVEGEGGLRGSAAPKARGGARSAAPLDRGAAPALAILSMACRFAGAEDPEAFWEQLRAGRSPIAEIPESRWDARALHDPSGRRPASSSSRWGALLEDPYAFDPLPFGIEPAEAAFIDPHQRLMLEVGAEALDRGGYGGQRRAGARVGVFVGAGESGFQEAILPLLRAGADVHPMTAIGNLRNLVAARLAHASRLEGPALVVDSACSSALMALHLARASLLAGECDLALVGGVRLLLTPTPYQLLSRAGALSPTGRSSVFGADRDGLVPGEGAACLLLSSQAWAERRGDPILGLLEHTSVNNDGGSISPMAPNPEAQRELLTRAYRESGIDPLSITYVEAHGTATPIGDRIEAQSLARTLGRSAARPLWIGSVKGSHGHLLEAAAMPSLLKVLLAFAHRALPPSLGAAPLDPQLGLEEAGLEVLTAGREWSPEAGRPLRAGIDSFGFGGTNVHAILAQAPPPLAPAPVERPAAAEAAILALSAPDEPRLFAHLERVCARLERPATDPAALALGVSVSFSAEAHRLAIVAPPAELEAAARSALEASRAAPARLPEGSSAELHRGHLPRHHHPRVAFLLPGQGMPRGPHALRAAEPALGERLVALLALAQPEAAFPLEQVLEPGIPSARLADTALAQPLLVALGIALGERLQALGVRPEAIVGHSVGELAAAALAGALEPAAAMRIAAIRGRLMAELPAGGGMLAVASTASILEAALGDLPGLVLSADNGSERLVVSGALEGLRELALRLDAQGLAHRPLETSHAFHSPAMRPILEPLREALGALASSQPLARAAPLCARLLSTSSCEWLEPRLGDPEWIDHLVDHVLSPVRFGPAIERLLAEGYDTFVELGEGALGRLVGRVAASGGRSVQIISLLGAPERGLSGALGRLFVAGLEPDFEAHRPGLRRLSPPPRPRFPLHLRPPAIASEPAHAGASPHPLLGPPSLLRLGEARYPLRASGVAALHREHRVRGASLLPGAALIEVARVAAARALQRSPAALEQLAFLRPVLAPAEAWQIHLQAEAGGAAFRIEREGEHPSPQEAARGHAREQAAPPPPLELEAEPPALERMRSAEPSWLYAELRARGMEHGPLFQRVASLALGAEGESAGRIIPDSRSDWLGSLDPSALDPALLDAAIQIAAAPLLRGSEGVMVPFHLDSIHLLGPLRGPAEVRGSVKLDSSQEIAHLELDIFSPGGARLLALRGLTLRRLALGSGALSGRARLEVPRLEPIPLGGRRDLDWILGPGAEGLAPALGAEVIELGAACAELVEAAPKAALWLPPEQDAIGALLELGQALLVSAGSTLRIVIPDREGSRATLGALAEAMADELQGRVQVLELPAPLGSPAALELLGAELGGVRRIVCRGALPHRLEFGPAPPASSEDRPAPRPEARLGPGSVHLVLGGGSGIGLLWAERLARLREVTIHLVGRRRIEDDSVRREAIEGLRGRHPGAALHYHALDLSHRGSLEGLIRDLLECADRLDTVVHGAGIAELGGLRGFGPEALRRALDPKLGGAEALLAVARTMPRPPAIVLLSSIASAIPGLSRGLLAYGAANGALDALAEREHARGLPITSLGLSLVRGTGMGDQPLLEASMRERGLPPIEGPEAVEAIEAALGVDRPRQLFLRRAQPAAPHDLDAAAPARGSADPLEAFLQRRLGRALGLAPDRLSCEISFLALGLESLAALELVRQLEREAEISLPATLFFEHRTIRELAHALRPHAPRLLASGPARTPSRPGPEGPFSPLLAAPSAAAAPEAEPCHTPLPLLPPQRALLASHTLYPEAPAFSMLRLSLEGRLELEPLGEALLSMQRRHPMLRARFEGVGSAARQRIAEIAPASELWSVRDLDQSLADAEERAANHRFDLALEPPLRVEILREHAERWHLLLILHHAAADAWSLKILAEELLEAHAHLARDAPWAPPPPRASFEACVRRVEAREGAEAARQQVDLAFFRQAISAHPRARALRLPWRAPPSRPGARIRLHREALDPGERRLLFERARRFERTPFELLLTALMRCLSRWGAQPEISVNVALAGRDLGLEGVDEVIGCFADTLPVHARLDPEAAFAESLGIVARALRQTLAHASPSSAQVARLLPRVGATAPVASPVGLSYARFPMGRGAEGHDLRVSGMMGATASAATRLGVAIFDSGEGLGFSFASPEGLFEKARVAALAGELMEELRAVARGAAPAPTSNNEPAAPSPGASPPLARVAGPASGSAAELAPSSAPSAPGSMGSRRPLIGSILAQAEARPEAIALVEGDHALSYRELLEGAAAVAAGLEALPAGPVGVLGEGGAEILISIVGVLLADRAWIPLDAELPEARIGLQLERSGARALLHRGADRQAAEAVATRLGIPRLGSLELPPSASPPRAPIPAPSSWAYVIFTSGSTGEPKGVPISHHGLELYLHWAIETFGYGPEDRLLQTASIGFDASVRQLLAPLMVGACVVIAPRSLARDPARLLGFLAEARITVFSSVPSLWARLVEAAESSALVPSLEALRWIHVGGEALLAEGVRRWIDRFGEGARISNLYGPTEATINATCFIVPSRPSESERAIPIGLAVAETELRIATEGGAILPLPEAELGVEGELLIGGPGLSPGYLISAQAESSGPAPDPFLALEGERFYRSGDRVRLLEGGTLLFLGRVDAQLKIRGYRIEPGEIEAALVSQPGVREALVRAEGDRLVAHLEPEGAGPEIPRIRASLGLALPGYMIPHRFEMHEALPRTVAGKLDRAALGAGRVCRAEPLGGPPETETERLVSAIWAQVLGLERIAREDDFFDLGGDSISLLEVFEALGREGRALPRPTVIYAQPTLRALCRILDEMTAPGIAAPALPGAAGAASAASAAPFALSPTQTAFVLAEAMEPSRPPIWMSQLHLEGILRFEPLQAALELMLRRHPMLRTVFPGGLRARAQRELLEGLRLPIAFHDLGGLSGPEQDAALEAGAMREARRPLPLDTWPLLRITLYRLGPERSVLLVLAHHIIGDGFSLQLLLRELFEAYDSLCRGEAPSLPALRSSFREHAQRLAERAPAPEDREYWRARMARPYGPPSFAGADPAAAKEASFWRSLWLDPARRGRLEARARAEGTSLPVLLLAIYAQAIAALSGADDLVIGVATSGREEGLEGARHLVGPFATALPVRLSPGERVAQTLREARLRFEGARLHAIDPRQIAALLPAETPIETAMGARTFFTYLGFEALAPIRSETLRLHLAPARATLSPAGRSDLLLIGRPQAGGGLQLEVQGSARALDEAALEALVERVDREARALEARAPEARALEARALEAHATSALESGSAPAPASGPTHPPIDAALIAYLPSAKELGSMLGLEPEAVRAAIRERLGAGPRHVETLQSSIGRSAAIVLPRLADGLAGPGLLDALEEAVRQAAQLGARVVSLAGMIPSLTGYGFDLRRRLGASAPILTTGHAATAVVVERSLRSALRAIGARAPCRLTLLGVGSIGQATLALALAQGLRPEQLLLIDRPPARLALE